MDSHRTAPYRRADGLWALGLSCRSALPDLALPILSEAAGSFLACRPGWKRDWRLAFLTTWAIAPLDNERAIDIARGIADGRKRRQTLRRLGVLESEVR